MVLTSDFCSFWLCGFGQLLNLSEEAVFKVVIIYVITPLSGLVSEANTMIINVKAIELPTVK